MIASYLLNPSAGDKTMEDAILVTRTQQGDREAFGKLIVRYQGEMYRLCYGVVGNASDAEDLVHDAFVEAYLKIDQVRQPERFRAWLRTLTLNLCRMWIRRRKHTIRVEEMTDEELAETELVCSPTGEDDEMAPSMMKAAMSGLSYKERLILVLHYWEGLSYDEIASFLDIPRGTVMSRLHRARERLKKEMLRMPEEVKLTPDENFGEEVMAEIEILLSAFGDYKKRQSSIQRLSVLLEHSPNRLEDLIRTSENESQLSAVALVLGRLGGIGVDAVLHCYFDPEPTVQENALTVLQGLMKRSRGHFGAPPLRLYLLLDKLIVRDVPDAQKVNLLLALHEMEARDGATNLLAEMLMCYKPISVPLLLEKVCGVTDANQIDKRVVSALCRIGTELCERLLDWLDGDSQAQLLALIMLEAFAHVFYASTEPGILKKFPKLPDTVAMHHNYWLIPHEYIDENIIALTKERVAPLIESDDGVVRRLGIAILGGLRAREYVPKLVELSQHADSATRHAVIRALGAIKDIDAISALERTVGTNDEVSLRRTAVQMLGMMKDEQCLPILTAALSDDNAQIRGAAVTALAEIPDDKAGSVLREITKSPDKNLARTAAKALHSSGFGRRSSELKKKRLAKIRGTEEEGFQFYISLPAVMRTLPEDREYSESELTRLIAHICADYSTTRRYLVMDEPSNLMTRTTGIFRMTDLGRAVWRVEHFIRARYLKG